MYIVAIFCSSHLGLHCRALRCANVKKNKTCFACLCKRHFERQGITEELMQEVILKHVVAYVLEGVA